MKLSETLLVCYQISWVQTFSMVPFSARDLSSYAGMLDEYIMPLILDLIVDVLRVAKVVANSVLRRMTEPWKFYRLSSDVLASQILQDVLSFSGIAATKSQVLSFLSGALQVWQQLDNNGCALSTHLILAIR